MNTRTEDHRLGPDAACLRKPQPIKSSRLALGATLILAAAVASLAGCSAGSKTSTARASTQIVVPVAVATAERRDVPVYLKGLGTVTASNTVSVKSRVDGQLAQINFKEGQHVNKGELLAVIDPRPFQAALEQAQANLFRDQAQQRDAQLNYERFKSLMDQSGAMSKQQVDTQKAAAEQLEGAVHADQAAIDNCQAESCLLAHHRSYQRPHRI